CRRIREAGRSIYVSAGAVLYHRKSASLRKSNRFSDETLRINRALFNHLWRDKIGMLQDRSMLHHPMRRTTGKIRALFVAHGHPPEQIGGTEMYNRYLSHAVGALPEFEVVVLSRGLWNDPSVPEGIIVQDRD